MFGKNYFCQLILLFNFFLLLFMGSTAFFDTIYGSYCIISANFQSKRKREITRDRGRRRGKKLKAKKKIKRRSGDTCEEENKRKKIKEKKKCMRDKEK